MGDSLILIETIEADFLTLIGRLETLSLIMVGKEDTQILGSTPKSLGVQDEG